MLFVRVRGGDESSAERIIGTAEQASYLELPLMDEALPLVFSDTLEEAQIQEQLKRGAVVLPLGVDFGEEGNVVITAHSSGLNKMGPYRFAFHWRSPSQFRCASLEANQKKNGLSRGRS